LQNLSRVNKLCREVLLKKEEGGNQRELAITQGSKEYKLILKFHMSEMPSLLVKLSQQKQKNKG